MKKNSGLAKQLIQKFTLLINKNKAEEKKNNLLSLHLIEEEGVCRAGEREGQRGQLPQGPGTSSTNNKIFIYSLSVDVFKETSKTSR